MKQRTSKAKKAIKKTITNIDNIKMNDRIEVLKGAEPVRYPGGDPQASIGLPR